MTVKRSRVWLLMVGMMLVIFSSISILHAQEAPVILIPDTPVEGTLGGQNLADVYSVVVSSAGVATITAESSETDLVLLVTDAAGNMLAETAAENGAATIELDGLAVGTYFVTVSGGANAAGVYTIGLAFAAVEVTEAPVVNVAPSSVVTTFEVPGDVLLNSGMEVRLSWSAAVDLNLEVRDPRGNTLYFDSRTSPVGGSFGFDANGLCEVITATPTETATWLPGFLPAGSYEILVFYRQACEQPASAVDFTITTTVNGTTLAPVQASLLPPPTSNQDSVYLANFIVSEDGTATMNSGGSYPDSAVNQLPAPFAELQQSAVQIERELPVQGAIFEAQDQVVYSFEAQTDEVLSVSLTATSGNLDTLLQLVDPNGNLIAVNDDANFSTSSALSNIRILQGGTYLIVATRYGKDLGGTEGEFQVVVSETSASLAPELANLNLPDGDIQVYLTWNTNADLQLLVRDPVGQSVYDDNPRVNSGGLLAAGGNVGCQTATDAPVSYIYWPLGLLRPGIYETEVWFQNTCEDTTPVEFSLTIVVRGQVVAVERQLPSIGDRFVISFEVLSDGSAVAGRGGFISSGSSILNYQAETPLPISINQPVNGSITLDNAFDVYAFQGQIGQIVTISLQAIPGTTLDTNLFLIGPSGVQIANNDDADPALVIGTQGRTTDSLISTFTLPVDGEYLILASRFGTIYGGTVGGYQLSVQLNN